MKATIDGILCEGTPEEISKFKSLRDAINQDKMWDSLKKKEGVKSPFTDNITIPSKPYVWEGKGSPFIVKFNKTNGGSSKINKMILW